MQKQKQVVGLFSKCIALAAVTVFVAGCVVEPYPPPPPPPVAYAPAPGPAPAYYGGPYSYYEYPPYYAGPSVGFVFQGGGGYRGGYHHWR